MNKLTIDDLKEYVLLHCGNGWITASYDGNLELTIFFHSNLNRNLKGPPVIDKEGKRFHGTDMVRYVISHDFVEKWYPGDWTNSLVEVKKERHNAIPGDIGLAYGISYSGWDPERKKSIDKFKELIRVGVKEKIKRSNANEELKHLYEQWVKKQRENPFFIGYTFEEMCSGEIYFSDRRIPKEDFKKFLTDFKGSFSLLLEWLDNKEEGE